MPADFATRIMEELIDELGSELGPCERVVEEVFRDERNKDSLMGIFSMADAAMLELRKTWGPSANPNFLEDIIQESEEVESDPEEEEYACQSALFRRAGIWGYVQLRAKESISSGEKKRLRLVLGVARDMTRW